MEPTGRIHPAGGLVWVLGRCCDGSAKCVVQRLHGPVTFIHSGVGAGEIIVKGWIRGLL